MCVLRSLPQPDRNLVHPLSLRPSSEATPSELRLWWQYYGSSRERRGREEFPFLPSDSSLAFPRALLYWLYLEKQLVSIYHEIQEIENKRRTIYRREEIDRRLVRLTANFRVPETAGSIVETNNDAERNVFSTPSFFFHIDGLRLYKNSRVDILDDILHARIPVSKKFPSIFNHKTVKNYIFRYNFREG